MIVFLIGFMGSGKTTVGKKLAKKLKFEFIDLDSLIEQNEKSTVTEIFEKKGEAFFREIEHKTLISLFSKKQVAISCGGGTPCFFDAINLMNEVGKTIYLKMSSEAIFSRLYHAKVKRPLINNMNDDELRNFITSKLEEREPIYAKAKIICNALNFKLSDIESVLKP